MLPEDNPKLVPYTSYRVGEKLTPLEIRRVFAALDLGEVRNITDHHRFFSQNTSKPPQVTDIIHVAGVARHLTIGWDQTHPEKIGAKTSLPPTGNLSIVLQSGDDLEIVRRQAAQSNQEVMATVYHELLHVVLGIRRTSGNFSGSTCQSFNKVLLAARSTTRDLATADDLKKGTHKLQGELNEVLFDRPAWRIALTIPHKQGTENEPNSPVRQAWTKIWYDALEFAAEEVWAMKIARRRFVVGYTPKFAEKYAEATIKRMVDLGGSLGARMGSRQPVDDFSAYVAKFQEFINAVY